MIRRLVIWLMALILAAPLLAIAAPAQDTKLKKEELDQLLAPVALYPDDLLTTVLMAATYPLEVVQAARWRKEPANAKLKGDALTKALEVKDWDPSVKALAQFPDVLAMMSDKLDWTQKLGDAMLAQQADVMDEIQFLRQKADDRGTLKSNAQQKVTRKSEGGSKDVIVIEPASPDVVYVPVYEPAVAYGPWWYPDYPPYYWPPAGTVFSSGFFWGTGVAIAASIWGWNHCDWRNHNINVDVDRFNKINVNNANRNRITSGTWEHNAYHRRGVKYNNQDVRDKFAKTDLRPGKDGRADFRGHDGKQVLKPGGDRPDAGNRRPSGDSPKAANIAKKDRAASGNRPAADRRPAGGGDRAHHRDNAFSNVQSRAAVQNHVNRGRSSLGGGGHRAPHVAARGGGGAHIGGGGGHRGGGRRR